MMLLSDTSLVPDALHKRLYLDVYFRKAPMKCIRAFEACTIDAGAPCTALGAYVPVLTGQFTDKDGYP